MTARQSTPTSEHSSHSDNAVRKRVCKACDRCRLKKSKCDGTNPCGRCRADNAICVFGERKKAHDKVYPKGYVEMLEQQQVWLIHGLQELYRRTTEGEGWPGEPLKCESNGHPLIHDLLTRLGALDHRKSEHFEESTEAMQQDLWRRNSGHMQHQDSSDSCSDHAQSPVIPSRYADAYIGRPHPQHHHHHHHHPQVPPTPPSYSPLSRSTTATTATTATQPTLIKQEPSITPTPSPYAPTSLPMQGVVNPLALQGPPQHWPQPPSDSFCAFDEMDLMTSADYTSLSFDNHSLNSPMFNRAVPVNCMTSFLDSKADYDDLNQFLNPNATEITSI